MALVRVVPGAIEPRSTGNSFGPTRRRIVPRHRSLPELVTGRSMRTTPAAGRLSFRSTVIPPHTGAGFGVVVGTGTVVVASVVVVTFGSGRVTALGSSTTTCGLSPGPGTGASNRADTA